jgi:rubredoxin
MTQENKNLCKKCDPTFNPENLHANCTKIPGKEGFSYIRVEIKCAECGFFVEGTVLPSSFLLEGAPDIVKKWNDHGQENLQETPS